MYAERHLLWPRGAEGGTYKRGLAWSTRLQNLGINTKVYEHTYFEWADRLLAEAKRMNNFMRNIPVWE